MPTKLTDKFMRDLQPPASGNRIEYDTEVGGFGARVTKAGARSFILNYRIHGRERRFTIGAYPAWSVMAAREEAKALRRKIDQGVDPLGKRIEDREAPTVDDLWKEYEAKHLPTKRPRAAADDRSMWRAYILPKLGAEKVRDVTAEMVDDLHSEIGRTKAVRANRVIEVLRKAFNLAIRWEWTDRNPCAGFSRNKEEARERFLTYDEMEMVGKLLDKARSKASADAIRLMMFTGARKGEVLGATWPMFDLDAGVWLKPSAHTKQDKVHRVPLSRSAVALLKRIKEGEGADPVFVFPGPGKEGHITDVKRTWDTVRTKAKIPDVHIHDLRHTFASVLASSKVPLQVVGALLGHTQAQTTKRYAHLYDDPQREAAEIAAAAMGKANGAGPVAEKEKTKQSTAE